MDDECVDQLEALLDDVASRVSTTEEIEVIPGLTWSGGELRRRHVFRGEVQQVVYPLDDQAGHRIAAMCRRNPDIGLLALTNLRRCAGEATPEGTTIGEEYLKIFPKS